MDTKEVQIMSKEEMLEIEKKHNSFQDTVKEIFEKSDVEFGDDIFYHKGVFACDGHNPGYESFLGFLVDEKSNVEKFYNVIHDYIKVNKMVQQSMKSDDYTYDGYFTRNDDIYPNGELAFELYDEPITSKTEPEKVYRIVRRYNDLNNRVNNILKQLKIKNKNLLKINHDIHLIIRFQETTDDILEEIYSLPSNVFLTELYLFNQKIDENTTDNAIKDIILEKINEKSKKILLNNKLVSMDNFVKMSAQEISSIQEQDYALIPSCWISEWSYKNGDNFFRVIYRHKIENSGHSELYCKIQNFVNDHKFITYGMLSLIFDWEYKRAIRFIDKMVELGYIEDNKSDDEFNRYKLIEKDVDKIVKVAEETEY